MPKVLLDTNVFIFSIEQPLSNSHVIIDMLVEGEIEAVISEEIKLELIEYLKSEYGRSARYHAELFLEGLPKLEIIDAKRIKARIKEYKGKIKGKDLPHLVAAEIARVEYIVSYDRDFKRAKTSIEVLTPREFVSKLGLKPFNVEY